MLAAVACRTRVITHGRADSGHFVRDHARANASTVDHNTHIALPTRHGLRHRICEIRIIHGLCRVRAEILMIKTKVSKNALQRFLHLKAAMIGSDRYSFPWSVSTDAF